MCASVRLHRESETGVSVCVPQSDYIGRVKQVCLCVPQSDYIGRVKQVCLCVSLSQTT